MKKLFNPAIWLMNRLSYRRKFGLISLLFISPLALVLALFIVSVNEQMASTQKEIDGDTYLRRLRRLLEHTVHHKSLAYDYLSRPGIEQADRDHGAQPAGTRVPGGVDDLAPAIGGQCPL